jgi:hypothetical protein
VRSGHICVRSLLASVKPRKTHRDFSQHQDPYWRVVGCLVDTERREAEIVHGNDAMVVGSGICCGFPTLVSRSCSLSDV